MKIIRDGQIIDDSWCELPTEGQPPEAGDWIVDFQRLQQAGRDALLGGNARLAIRIPNTLDVEAAYPELQDADMLVLDFPAYSDGRAYSQARLLKERLAYGGQIRAGGDVIRDQVWEMVRCGFTEIQPRQDYDLQACLQGYRDFSLAYQNAADQRGTIFGRRAGSKA